MIAPRLHANFLAALAVAGVCVGCAPRRDARVGAPLPVTRDSREHAPVSQEGVIVPGDLLLIRLSSLTGPGVPTPVLKRVNESGDIVLPVIGNTHVQGIPLEKLSTYLKRKYDDAHATEVGPIPVTRLEAGPSSHRPVMSGDLLRISVTDLVGPGVKTSRECRVDENGNILLPLVGTVRVAGVPLDAMPRFLENAYTSAGACLLSGALTVERFESVAPAAAWRYD